MLVDGWFIRACHRGRQCRDENEMVLTAFLPELDDHRDSLYILERIRHEKGAERCRTNI